MIYLASLHLGLHFVCWTISLTHFLSERFKEFGQSLSQALLWLFAIIVIFFSPHRRNMMQNRLKTYRNINKSKWHACNVIPKRKVIIWYLWSTQAFSLWASTFNRWLQFIGRCVCLFFVRASDGIGFFRVHWPLHWLMVFVCRAWPAQAVSHFP